MERGELWWAQIDEKRPVVLLSGGPGPEFAAVQIVEPATPSQKLGFVLMSGEQAVDVDERRRIVAEAGPDIRAIGIEVFFGAEEGLEEGGVVRVALPQERQNLLHLGYDCPRGVPHREDRRPIPG